MSTCEPSGGDPYPLSSHSYDPNPPEVDNLAADAHHIPPDPLLDSGSFIDFDLDSTGPALTGSKESQNGASEHQHGAQEPVNDEPELPARPAPDVSNCTDTSATAAATATEGAESTPPGRKGAPQVPVELLPERPKWLPEGWVMDCRIRSSGASAGSIDRPHADHVVMIFMDLNVIPKDEVRMLAKEEEAQDNDTRNTKPTKNETQKLKHDELDPCKNLVAAILNRGDALKMRPVVETTTKPLPSQRQKRQPALAALSVPLQKRPEWLPWGWWIDYRVRSSGASAGLVDKYYFDPVSSRRFRSKKEVDYFLETGSTRKRKRDADTNSLENSGGGRKNSAPLNFDFNDVPEKVRWVLTNASRDQWTPFIGDKMVPKSTRKEWTAAFHFSCS